MKSVMMLASGTAAGQLLLIMVSPIITRLYTPGDFGLFAVFGALLALTSVISSLRYELAIPLPKSDNQAVQVLVLSLFINMGFVIAFSLMLFYFNQELTGLLNIGSHTLFLLPIGVLTIGIYKAFNYWAIRKQEYRVIGQTKFTQSVANVITQVFAGFLNFGVYGLIIAQIIGQSFGILSLFRVFRKFMTRVHWRMSRPKMKIQLKRFYRFPLYDTPAALMNTFSEQLPQFLLAVLFNPFIAGFYLLAHRILMAPLSIIGQAVGQVIYGCSNEKLQKGEMGHLALKVAMSLWGLMLVPAIILWFKADTLFAFAFGEIWREAGNYASWMILGIAVQFAYSPLSVIFLATENQHINFILHLSIMLCRILMVYLGWLYGDALISVIGYSIVGLIGYGAGVFMIIFMSFKADNPTFYTVRQLVK